MDLPNKYLMKQQNQKRFKIKIIFLKRRVKNQKTNNKIKKKNKTKDFQIILMMTSYKMDTTNKNLENMKLIK